MFPWQSVLGYLGQTVVCQSDVLVQENKAPNFNQTFARYTFLALFQSFNTTVVLNDEISV